jgi:hypothetical protein
MTNGHFGWLPRISTPTPGTGWMGCSPTTEPARPFHGCLFCSGWAGGRCCPSQPQTPEAQIALEVSEQHLDLSTLPSRAFERLRSFQRAHVLAFAFK